MKEYLLYQAVLCCIFSLSNSWKKILKWTGANKTVTRKKRGRLLVNTHTIILQSCWSKVPQTSRINCWDVESSSESRWSTALRLVLVWFVICSLCIWRIIYNLNRIPWHMQFWSVFNVQWKYQWTTTFITNVNQQICRLVWFSGYAE